MNTKKLKNALIAARVNYKEICQKWQALSDAIVDNWQNIWQNAQLLSQAQVPGVTITTGTYGCEEDLSKTTQRINIHSKEVHVDLCNECGITQARGSKEDGWCNPNWNIGDLTFDLLYSVNDIIQVLFWDEDQED